MRSSARTDTTPMRGRKRRPLRGSGGSSSLDGDRDFLKKGGVMDDDQIDAYIDLKMEEVLRFEMHPHPVEFDMYYSC